MNGFYPMLNDVHDKAVKDLPLAECALFEHIWRKLIGWNQFEDEISISQLVKETSGSRSSVIRLLDSLEEKRWIIVTRQISDTNRNFTSKIAIPACPGIKMKLGWYQNDTRGSVKSIPGGGVKSIHTTDSSLTDNLQTTPPTPQNDVREQESAENENGAGGGLDSQEGEEEPRMVQKAMNFQGQVWRKWREQLEEEPDLGSCKEALREFDWDHKLLESAVDQSPQTLTHPDPVSAVNLVLSVTRRLRRGEDGGINPAILDDRRREIAKLKSDLAEARKKPEENAVWISQKTFILEEKQTALESLKGE